MAEYNFGSDKFINPYTFVSVEEGPTRLKLAEIFPKEETLHTGSLHCRLTTKTPLAIPDTQSVETELITITKSDKKEKIEHKIYSANRIGEQIVIPGSSLRGMLRNVYETATNSCMVTLDSEERITRRSDLGSFTPCVLKKEDDENWHLYKAKRIALVASNDWYKPLNEGHAKFEIHIDKKGEKYIESDSAKIYFGDEVAVEIDTARGHEKRFKGNKKREVWEGGSVKSIKPGKNTNDYLFLGEAISNKHAESVFRIIDDIEEFSVEVIKTAMKGLEDTLDMYRSESINRNLTSAELKEKHFGYRGYEKAKQDGAIPLWYKKGSNGILYLSLAAIGRIAYKNSMADISCGHYACSNRDGLCPACSLFGMVGSGDGQNFGSRIRVSDAYASEDKCPTTHSATLIELGSPRVSYLNFYSTDGKDFDDRDASIRGRKFYWHIPAVNRDSSIYSTSEKTLRNATMELINRDHSFEFDVYFDGITDDQLQMLMWSIELPSEGNESLMHKLGHGKPIGLGSVKIEIMSKNERSLNGGYTISSESAENSIHGRPALLHEASWRQLREILEFDPDYDVAIRYPYVELSNNAKVELSNANLKPNDLASHHWFKRNTEKLCGGKYELRILELTGINSTNNNNYSGKKRYDDSYRQKKEESRKPESGKIYKGKVTGHNKSGYYANVKLLNGEKASFRDYDNLPDGTPVEVMCKGEGRNGYYQWELVKPKK